MSTQRYKDEEDADIILRPLMDLLNERLGDSFFHIYEFETLKFV